MTDQDHTTKPAASTEIDLRQNVLAGLRAKRERADRVIQGTEFLERPLGIAGPEVVVRYKYVPLADAQKQGKMIEGAPESQQGYLASCDTLVLACHEIMLQVGGELVPLALPGEEPVTFNTYRVLGEHLEFDTSRTGYTSRTAILDCFKSEYAVVQEAQFVSQWMATLGGKGQESFLSN